MQRHRSLVTAIFIDMKKFRYSNKEQDAQEIASEPNLYATNEESSLLMDTDSQYGDWTPEDLMKVLQKSDKDFAEEKSLSHQTVMKQMEDFLNAYWMVWYSQGGVDGDCIRVEYIWNVRKSPETVMLRLGLL